MYRHYKVYIHRRLDTNDIFYVGYGKNNRPNQHSRGRSQGWQTTVAAAGGFTIDIVGTYPNKHDACIHEQMYIGMCRDQGIPIVNVKDGGLDRNIGCAKSAASRKKISAARLTTNGNAKQVKTPLGIFPSMAQAATAHNMSVDQLYYRVRIKPGFDHT